MQPFSAIALFCEDIREEKSGQDTLVGILPDNIRVPSVPGMLAKLGVYLRVHIDAAADVESAKAKVRMPGGRELEFAEIDLRSLFHQAKRGAQQNGLPHAGVIVKMMLSPCPVPASGHIEVVLEIDGDHRLCGVLNVVVAKQPEPAAAPT